MLIVLILAGYRACQVEPFSKVNEKYFVRHKISDSQAHSTFQAFDHHGTLFVLQRLKYPLKKAQYCLVKEMSRLGVSETFVQVLLDSSGAAVLVYKSSFGLALGQLEDYAYQPDEIRLTIYKLLQKLAVMHEGGYYHGKVDINSVIFRQNPNFDVFLCNFKVSSSTINQTGPAQDVKAVGELIKVMFKKSMIESQGNIQQTSLAHHLSKKGISDPSSIISSDRLENRQLDQLLKQQTYRQYQVWKSLIAKMVQPDQAKRITAGQALKDPIFRALFNTKMFRQLNK